jgi:hypothetical protein
MLKRKFKAYLIGRQAERLKLKAESARLLTTLRFLLFASALLY